MAQTKQKTKNATKSNTTKRKSSSTATTKAHERDGRVIATDAAYALTGVAADALQLANEALDNARQLPDRVRETNRDEVEKRLQGLRDRAEKRFDEKATQGRTVTDDLRKNKNVKQVLDQAKTARSQVKAALTSVRKTANRTVEAGISAGREQASTARTQTKAAATSIQKTAAAAVEASREVVSNGRSKS